MDDNSHNSINNGKKKNTCSFNNKNNDCDIMSLPAMAGTIAAIIAEGKTPKEIEVTAAFLNLIANSLFLIASTKSKIGVTFIEI